jgi:hypothetical protein
MMYQSRLDQGIHRLANKKAVTPANYRSKSSLKENKQ